MSAYPWMKRHKRYLSFRYLFPELAAAWIQFKRVLLRILWFFTHPIDEFLDDIRDAMLWPFTALNTLWRWMVIGIHEFFTDLLHGIEMAFGWMGGLPVWTGAAVSGVMGVILTILLFLLPAIDAGVTTRIEPSAQATAELASILPSLDIDPAPAPSGKTFDPFAVQQPLTRQLPLPGINDSLPTLEMQLTRLPMPQGWSSRQQISVLSMPSKSLRHADATAFASLAWNDRWSQARLDRVRRLLDFTPYVSRVGVSSTSVSTSWVRPEPVVEPLDQYSTERHPSVVVEKSAIRTAPVGQPFTYALVVKNIGEETLDSVMVREQISDIKRVSNTEPLAKVVNDELVWDLAELRPGERRQLTVELHPNQEVALAHRSVVEVTTGVAAVSNVRRPRPEFPEPLSDPLPEPDPKPLVQPEPALPEAVLPSFIEETEPQPESVPLPQQPFPEMLPLDEEPAFDFPPQAEENSVRIEEPPAVGPTLSLEMFAPQAVAAGSDVRTVFEVHNKGPDDMSELILTVDLTEELEHAKGPTLELKIPHIAAGQVFRTRLTTEAVKNGTAKLSSRLTNATTESLTAQREVRISDDVAPPADVVYDSFPQCPPFPCGSPL